MREGRSELTLLDDVRSFTPAFDEHPLFDEARKCLRHTSRWASVLVSEALTRVDWGIKGDVA